ncbi:MAG: hypothetical protein R3B06_07995 [Kofleriaceae bacterium]
MRAPLALAAGLALAPAAAYADRYEATLTATVHGGMARVGAPGAAAETAPAFGGAVRLAHAWRNSVAWDVGIAGAVTQPATFRDAEATVNGRTVTGDATRRTATIAPQLGAELRWGLRRQPFVRAALGPQLRYQSAADVDIYPAALPAGWSLDAIASLGVGVDLRVGRRNIVGLALQLDHGQPVAGGAPVDILGLTVRVGRAWYPRWWAPSW